MSQNDFNIANQGFPSFRADLNSALQALATTSSGATAPATPYANQLWYDTATDLLKMRNESNTSWIDLFRVSPTNRLYSIREVRYFSSGTAATYTPPTGTQAIRVTCVGAGGGGGAVDGQGAGTGGAAGGGGAGGVTQRFITSVAASYTYTVGAGGVGGAAGANDGASGGNTTFTDGVALTMTAGGGAGGGARLASSSLGLRGFRGNGGSASGGDLNVVGSFGSNGYTSVQISSVGDGGVSSFGRFGAGGAVSGSTGGVAGGSATGFNAGGGGASVVGETTNYAGGDGAGGLIIIEEFA